MHIPKEYIERCSASNWDFDYNAKLGQKNGE